jgi:UDP-3-O-[3-hydroxymyristoyl] N-acetylglucosamine deacetylase
MEGRGLHTGRPGRLRFERTDGATTLGSAGERVELRKLRVEGRDRCSVAVFPSGRELLTVEHLLSAIVGASVFAGLHVEIEGDEVPLLDGGSARFLEAVARFARGGPSARVVRDATLTDGETTLELVPADETFVEVRVDYPAERFGRALRGTASWDGTLDSYRAIASARTFGAARELEGLRARGLAAYIEPGAVVALDLDEPQYAPTDSHEPIRHKLLDALGDLATLGGRFRGRAVINRPSHRGTRGAVGRALETHAIVLE